ncbi:MAG: DUF2235 domain-containing protein [Enterobacterales bacterium]|nr:DUF2235 domain-containing protein [Enterobacterales bacterium]
MKNIIICCDGTGNEYGSNNTNVVETFALAKKNSKQITYYDPGVGTGGWEYDESTGGLSAKSDSATGHGLQKNVLDAYQFLMECYEEGDRVYVFGFSRGAFTVRSLAGMLHKCGLLRADNDNLVDYASKIYNTKNNTEIAKGFKKTFARDCPVYFIGVWDTVKSLVLNAKKKFHDAKLNPEVSFGYHAVSIDERRKDFPEYLWDVTNKIKGQVIEQVWFAGVHADVGGWYHERGLANISLQWMMKKAKSCGMLVDNKVLNQFKADPYDIQHEEYKGFWRFRGTHKRQIAEGSFIHESVKKRLDKNIGYKPKNLPENPKFVK